MGCVISILYILEIHKREDLLFRRISSLYKICSRYFKYLAFLCEEKCALEVSEKLDQLYVPRIDARRRKIHRRNNIPWLHVWNNNVSRWSHSILILVYLHASNSYSNGRLTIRNFDDAVPAHFRSRSQ